MCGICGKLNFYPESRVSPALVKAMAEPGLPLEQVFKKVIAGVDTVTHGKQRP